MQGVNSDFIFQRTVTDFGQTQSANVSSSKLKVASKGQLKVKREKDPGGMNFIS